MLASREPFECERPFHSDPLDSGAVLSDLMCAALVRTHEAVGPMGVEDAIGAVGVEDPMGVEGALGASFFVQSCLPTVWSPHGPPGDGSGQIFNLG
jgi:hypothetical protein